MRLPLDLHPDYLCPPVARIDVEVARPRPGTLALKYVVTGTIADLLLPPTTQPIRADSLWRHSCFEVFIRTPPASGYLEFNFAPSTQWAAYRFRSRRSGMSNVAELDAPLIEAQTSATSFTLTTTMYFDRLHDLATDATWTLSLSAVIEEANGRKSYWALAHPPGGADFHHPDCFVAELAPPGLA